METKKLNVFISQPMANETYENILKVRKRISEKVKKYFNTEDITFMDSYFIEEKYKVNMKNEPLFWLSKSIELLSNSDVIVMATGWENSRGCRIEYECARLYDIMVIFEDTNYITSNKLFEVDNDSIASN